MAKRLEEGQQSFQRVSSNVEDPRHLIGSLDLDVQCLSTDGQFCEEQRHKYLASMRLRPRIASGAPGPFSSEIDLLFTI